MKDLKFDMYQYAYMRNRSATDAIITVVEKVKRAVLHGEKAAAVFFDFTDAFGSVNRNHLLIKLRRDFGITGRLFLHIHSFLQDRLARIKFNDFTGDWLQSLFGTSAGTSLGPLLFIIQIHDVPKDIRPKFADDLVTVATGKDIDEIQASLQSNTDLLFDWSQKEGMTINPDKTKVMVFGAKADEVSIKVKDTLKITSILEFYLINNWSSLCKWTTLSVKPNEQVQRLVL